MKLQWNAESLAFRDEVRAFLDAKLTDDLRDAGARMTSVYADHQRSLQWQRILHEQGWAAPAWPKEHGGAGWSVIQRYIWTRERVAAGAPPISPMGIQMCGPAILGFGTAEQKARFLPKMLSGEEFWCQGYSEPGAGSDLASLRTRALIESNELVITGQKIWTTHADVADWGFFLVRTASAGRPQHGITFVLIDMTTPGIEVRPIISPSGEHIQNEVFLEDVRVPMENVVGEIHKGWAVAKHVLEFERGGVAYAPELQARLDEIDAAARERTLPDGSLYSDEPGFANALARCRCEVMALEIYEIRAMNSPDSGLYPAAVPSIMKIRGTELQQRVTQLALMVAGRRGLTYQPQACSPGGEIAFPHTSHEFVGNRFDAIAPLRYMNERAGSIYAGSNEIQRNIIARNLQL